jgi:cytidine deaminase
VRLRKFPAKYKETLIDKAVYTRHKAFSLISGSQVGAAILVYDGTVFAGSNIEFARSQNMHAEWVAAYSAMSYLAKTLNLPKLKAKMREGLEEIVAIAIVNNEGIPGCGPCRQMLYEINPNMQVLGVLPNKEIKVNRTIGQLYPHAYRSNDGLKL